MRIFIHICFLAMSASAIAQPAYIEDVKTYIATKQFKKANQLIKRHLEETTEEHLQTALWYYKGRLLTEQYFNDDHLEKDSDDVFVKKSYRLLEGIAAFQNTVKRQNQEYSESALRQLGGLHRYLKDIAFSNLHKKQYERFYLHLDWARRCDRFVQQHIPASATYEMDTMLIYLVAYGAELTGRNYKVKACYETLLLEGINEQQLFVDNYGMLMALGEMEKANVLLERGLLKHPNAVSLLKNKLHWLMTNEYYEKTIQFVNDKAAVLPRQERARFYFVKGLAWDARYQEASRMKLADADYYFKETEKAYQEAVSLSPKTFDFAYNLAALYYNKVVSIQPDSIPTTDSDEDYALLIERATETLETTLDLNAADRKVIDALEDIYKRTNQKEKLELLNLEKME